MNELERDQAAAKFFDSLQEGVLIIASDDRTIRFANAALLKMLGVDRGALVGRSVATLGILSDALAGSWESEATREVEVSIPREDASIAWFRVVRAPYSDIHDSSCGSMLTFLDLTEKKETEEALRKETARYQRILNTAAEGIVQIDPERKVQFLNHRMTEIIGYTADELIGRHLHELLPEDQIERVDMEQALRRQGKKSVYDLKYKRKDGRYVWLSTAVAPIFDDHGQFAGSLGMHMDITDRKAAEDRLREQHAFLEAVIQSSPNGIFSFDLELRITAWNHAMERMTGLTASETIGQSAENVRSTLGIQQNDSILELILQGQTIPYSEALRHRGEGTAVYFEAYFSALTDGSGKVTGGLAIVLDITERKKAEVLLNEQRQKLILSSKMSALGEMAGGIAHEINNPLAIIHGRADQLKELARRGIADQDSVERMAEKIRLMSVRIASIVKSLRTFARDGEKDPFMLQDVESLIGDTLEFCRERFRHRGIDVRIEAIPDECRIYCQFVQISQVLLNLLNNAYDAIVESPVKWIVISVTELPEVVEIAVTDSGTGISPELREKIFQPFFTTKEVGEGTGVGLSVSKGIVEAHGGQIYVDEHSRNTRFVVRIPKRQA